MRAISVLGVAVFAIAVSSFGALAQDATGMWQCQQANQTVSNNGFENWMYEFRLSLAANGTFQAQGSYYAHTNGYNLPFVAEGKWLQESRGVVAQGMQQRQDVGMMQFGLVFTNVSERQMSNQYDSVNGRLRTYCER